MISARWLSQDISDALYIRRAVFVIEQQISEEEEYDGQDAKARHIAAYFDETCVGAGRLIIENERCVIGRLCVLKEYRRQGVGELLVRAMIRAAVNAGCEQQRVHAQTAARRFYEGIGFTAYGDEFYEAGIPHINMKHIGDVAA